MGEAVPAFGKPFAAKRWVTHVASPTTPKGTNRRILLFSDPAGLALIRDTAPWFRPAAVVTASIRPDQLVEMEREAKRYAVPLLVQRKPTESGYAAFVRDAVATFPDLVLINSYSMILRPDFLTALGVPVLNIHAAPLPEFRGANPAEWALIEEASLSGVTIHHVDRGIDTGDIIAVERTPIFFEDTWMDLRERNIIALRGILREYLPIIANGLSLLGTKQDEEKARHFRRRSADDGELPWTSPLRQIYNFVRALVAPHPGTLLTAPSGSQRLMRFHTLPELTFLKHQSLSERLWSKGDLSLMPFPTPHRSEPPPREERIRENARLNFAVATLQNHEVGRCAIQIDWRSLTAPCRIEIDSPTSLQEQLAELAACFCERELLRNAIIDRI